MEQAAAAQDWVPQSTGQTPRLRQGPSTHGGAEHCAFWSLTSEKMAEAHGGTPEPQILRMEDSVVTQHPTPGRLPAEFWVSSTLTLTPSIPSARFHLTHPNGALALAQKVQEGRKRSRHATSPERGGGKGGGKGTKTNQTQVWNTVRMSLILH